MSKRICVNRWMILDEISNRSKDYTGKQVSAVAGPQLCCASYICIYIYIYIYIHRKVKKSIYISRYWNTFKLISIYSKLWKCHFQDFGNVISKALAMSFPKLWQCNFQNYGNVISKLFLAGARSCARTLKALEISFPKLFPKLWKWHFQNYLQKFLTKNKNNKNKRQSHF